MSEPIVAKRRARRSPQPNSPIQAADLFCGAGGTSTGLLAAAEELGLDVQLLAINHWDAAIATHTANHPHVTHRCESIDGADPRQLVPGGKLKFMWASPDCTHHSNARGGKPSSDQRRATPWHVCRWAEALDIETIFVENVRELRDWGPLHAECTCDAGPDAKKHIKPCKFATPIPEKKGKYYRNFLRNLRELGYTVEERLLNAADYGDATTRVRLIIQARKGRRPVWPEPTHRPPGSDTLGMYPDAKTWVPARAIIDWNIQGRSIYGRKKPLSPNTMARIVAGLRKYSGLPFLVPGFGDADGQAPRIHSVDSPVPTICAQGHIEVVQPFIVPQFNSAGPKSTEDPLGTLTTTSRGVRLIEPFIIGAGGPEGQGRNPQGVDGPLGTILTENHRAVIEPTITPCVVNMKGKSDASSIDKPIPTQTTKSHLYLAQPFLVVLRRNADGRSVEQPIPALCAGGQHVGIAESFVVPVTHSGGSERAHAIDQPLPVITTAHRGELAVVDSFLVKYYEGSDAVSVDEPVPTITANYEHIAVADPHLVLYHGNHQGKTDGERRVKSVDEPLPVVDTSNRMGVARPYLVKYYGTAGASSLDDPLDTVTARDRFALVSPEMVHLVDKGDVVGWLDIRFRMLQPHELAAAMGFPKDYKFTGNRDDQVKQIGNAVCVNLAKALVMAVLQQEARR